MEDSEPKTRVDGARFQACLDRIKHSEQFANSATLYTFLEHVVERAIDGEFDRLKASTLTADLYPEDAKKKEDPDGRVRSTATRVRQKLEDYSRSEAGQADPYHIKIPAGSYVPALEPGKPRRLGNKKRVGIGLLVAVVLTAAALLVWRLWPRHAPPAPAPPSVAATSLASHFIDLDQATDGAEVHYGSVVRGRASKSDKLLYVLVLDWAGRKYYAQPDQVGSAAIECPGNSWERQVWPGDPHLGDGQEFTIVVVRSRQPLPKEFLDPTIGFLKAELPKDAVKLRELRVRRVPPAIQKPHVWNCPTP